MTLAKKHRLVRDGPEEADAATDVTESPSAEIPETPEFLTSLERDESSDADTPPESVLGRLSRGEPGAMDALMERYGRLIWWMARRWNRHQADAEDAVQEILMDLWKSAASFDRAIGREEVYVSVIARRRLVDRHRSAKSQRASGCVELIDSNCVQPAASQAEITEECGNAMKMLADLEGDQDEVLRLAYAEGYTFKRIAQQMDLPVATVVSRVQRGLQRLQHLLKEEAAPRSEQSGR